MIRARSQADLDYLFGAGAVLFPSAQAAPDVHISMATNDTLAAVFLDGLASELDYMTTDEQAAALDRADYLQCCEQDEIADAADFIALAVRLGN